jgi:DNA damage-binding protein 1
VPTSAGVTPQLKLRHEHCGHILVLYIATRGDFILVGDLMKSVTLLQWSAASGQLTELARDYNSNWVTAVECLDDDTFVGAENSLNVFVTRKNAEATSDEERQRLEMVGEFHVGEFINRFRRGSLTIADSSLKPVPNLLFGTVNGVLGVIASITHEQFTFLKKVQDSLARVIRGVGGLSHTEWRAFYNERRTAEATNFIDGDLVEAFLDLPRDKMEEVVTGLDVTVDELISRVEELARLH